MAPKGSEPEGEEQVCMYVYIYSCMYACMYEACSMCSDVFMRFRYRHVTFGLCHDRKEKTHVCFYTNKCVCRIHATLREYTYIICAYAYIRAYVLQEEKKKDKKDPEDVARLEFEYSAYI